MKWLLENPWLLIVLAGLVAQIFKAIRGGKEGDQPVAPPKDYEFDDPDLAERTRKIREDIRRKIEQRRSQTAPVAVPEPEAPPLARTDRSPEATPPPVVIGLPEVIREVFTPPTPEPPPLPARDEQMRMAEEAERQAALAQQLEEAALMRGAAEKRVAFEAATADQEAALRTQTRQSVTQELRDPAALRRAFILREIIGPPVALR